MLSTLIHICTYNTFLAPETFGLLSEMDEWSIHLEMISLVMLSAFVTHSHLKHLPRCWDMRHETPGMGGWSPHLNMKSVMLSTFVTHWYLKHHLGHVLAALETRRCYLEVSLAKVLILCLKLLSIVMLALVSTLGNVTARKSAKLLDHLKIAGSLKNTLNAVSIACSTNWRKIFKT